jgi:deoxycytidylate deaminase
VQVGAAVLRPDHTVAGLGYNGAPAGIDPDWTDRDGRRIYVIHAEVNALRLTTPAQVRGGLLAVTHITCATCLPVAASYGISRIVYEDELDQGRYDTAHLTWIATQLGIRMGAICRALDGLRANEPCVRDRHHNGPHLNPRGGFFYTTEAQ